MKRENRPGWQKAFDEQIAQYLSIVETWSVPQPVRPDGKVDPPDKDSLRHREIEEQKLLHAEPIFVTAEMCDLVEAARPTFELEPLVESDFLVKAGFLHFEKTVDSVLDGFAWSLMKWPANATDPYSAHFTFYGTMNATIIEWDLDKPPTAGASQDTYLRGVAQTTLRLMREFRPASRYSTRERPDRAGRRAAKRAGLPEPEILVVRLRRERSLSERLGGSANYAYQFMVSGHWRNQWFPSSHTHRQVWIAPYITGSDDKPFRPPSRRGFHFNR
jgi:hypothetical protein